MLLGKGHTFIDCVVRKQIPAVDTQFLALIDEVMVKIVAFFLSDGKRNRPWCVERCFLPNPFGALIQAVVAQIHAEGQQRFLVDLGNGFLHQIVIGAFLVGQ